LFTLATNPENPNQQWVGKVSRINGKVNSATQTIQVFVALNHSDLKEGLFLEASIDGQEKLNALELPRNSIVDGNKIYVVTADSSLDLLPVEVVHKTRETIIVQGVDDQSWILSNPIPGAYVGMKVIIKK
jgi:multidrug efflux pump subunit AcrA (membrane-fusion protein)